MPDLLSVWNGALWLIKEPMLNNTDGMDKASRTLRYAMPMVTRKCLESGTWNFAQERRWLNRSSKTPVAGYQYYYEHPPGWLRTVSISATGLEDDPLLHYRDEGGLIATDREAVFMVYVSSEYDERAIGTWSQTFADYVSAALAEAVAGDLVSASADQMEELRKHLRKAKAEAQSFDAMQNPPGRLGKGRWARARTGGRGIASRRVG